MALWPRKKTGNNERVCNPDENTFAVFKSVGVTLGQRAVLQDLTLELSEERIGIVGLNGSGKSTFIRLLNGLRTPDSGTLNLFGAPSGAAESELPRHVGFVFQNPDHQAIFPTVEEEIAFGLSQLGADKDESRTRARAFLEQHGCLELAESPIAELSEGQKQLICILSVLVMEPKLLVLDEPMTSLDALAVRKIFGKLMSLPQKIVMVSHDLSHFDRFDRVIWLENGKVRMDGPPQPVLAAYRADIEDRSGPRMELASL